MAWTQESVLQLAPDAGSAKSGKELAGPRKWVSFHTNGQNIWGLCQGSGSKPYQTIVDLGEPAFKCSCPSRKFPCKHGLGLLLLYAADAPSFTTAGPPEWVTQWLTSRAERATKKAEAAGKPPAPIDVEAQAERREKRMDRIVAGLASLRTWVDDLIKQGIAAVPSRGYSFFDEPARRMVDAQAPGMAGMIQVLGATANSGAGWHGRFLRQLGSLHALLRAADRLDQLPAETRDDVMAAIGVPIPQDEVLARRAVADSWQVIAQEVEFADKLRVQRTWLFGRTTNRPALVLHFAHGTGPLDGSFIVGSEFEGDICFFPGNGIRAAVKTRKSGKPFDGLPGYPTLDRVCDAYSNLLAAQPWIGPVVLPVRQLVPVHRDQTWGFADATGATLPARMSPAVAWRTMAASGGHPIDLSVRFDGDELEPLAIASEGRYVSLATAHPGGAGIAG
jgi:hypothetical protein